MNKEPYWIILVFICGAVIMGALVVIQKVLGG